MKKGKTSSGPKSQNSGGSGKKLRIYAIAFVAVAVLGAGFFFAGRQHFSSMDVSMKNSKLRKQIDDLEAEKRRLILAREVAQSPSEIRKAAKKVGMEEVSVLQAQLNRLLPDAKAKATATASASAKPAMIVKTADVAPVKNSFPAKNSSAVKPAPSSTAGKYDRDRIVRQPRPKENNAE